MNDTDPQTEALYRELLMSRSAEERFLMGIEMCGAARATVLASLPAGLSVLERKVAIFRRYYETDFTARELDTIEASLRQDSAHRSADAIAPTLR
jgi:hypothetical protein